MKPLIAILTCHKQKEFQEACRDTWLRDWGKLIDYRFFIGEPTRKRHKRDEVYLDCPDGYHDLPLKLWYAMNWALVREYTEFFKCDDDTYVHIPRLLASGFEQHDYVGSRRQLLYAAGGPGYWLSQRAMKILVSHPKEEWARLRLEDSAVGCFLVMDQKALLHDDRRYIHSEQRWRYPTAGNDFITTHKCDPAWMHQVHAEFAKK